MILIPLLGLGLAVIVVGFVGLVMFLDVAFSSEVDRPIATETTARHHLTFDVSSIQDDSSLSASGSRVLQLVTN